MRATLKELDEPRPVPEDGISADETISNESFIFMSNKAFLTNVCSSLLASSTISVFE